jgi:hypothetical protein
MGAEKTVNDELHNLYYSPNIAEGIKSRMILGRACSTHGRDEKYIHFSLKTLNGRGHLRDLDIVEKIILKWI